MENQGGFEKGSPRVYGWNSSGERIKGLVGKDRAVVENHQAVQFLPKQKLILMTGKLLQATSNDKAFRERIHLIPLKN